MDVIEIYTKYHDLRTVSSKEYAKHLCIQEIGHSLGRKSANLIQPKPIRHNTYLCLIGQSGVSKKTTAQSDVLLPCVPQDTVGGQSFSPEGLLRELEENPHLISFLGEFSTLLRSIKGNGHMSRFKEIANDLWSCPWVYKKTLKNKENSYFVEQPYLSLNTTCTEEEFMPNLDPAMVHGGFMPRWILVCAEGGYRERGFLPDNIEYIEQFFKLIFGTLYSITTKNPIKFKLTKEAMDKFESISREIEQGEEFEEVVSFGVRYEDYIVKYADILYVSDLIGDMLKQYNIKYFESINQALINKLAEGLEYAMTGYLKNNLKEVDVSYIDKAWELLRPGLVSTKKLVTYFDEHYFVQKLLKAIDKVKEKVEGNELPISLVLQYSKLKSEEFRSALMTLKQREEIKVIIKETGEGRNKGRKEYIIL